MNATQLTEDSTNLGNTVHAIRWDSNTGELQLLDQRILPHTVEYLSFTDSKNTAAAITNMVVRGAPAIGITAAYGIALAAKNNEYLESAYQQLAASRPTAVNLFWALERMKAVQPQSHSALLIEAQAIHQEDIQANITMGRLGAGLLTENSQVYTHCNAGALATGGYGTALGVIRSAHKRGLNEIYAGETRPWLQGARLTVWELAQDDIAATLIADSAAAWLMKSGKLDWIIVGADRIAANGDVANKIGTYSLAVLAKQHGVKMMVVAPVSTIDFAMESGEGIDIEQRHQNELLADCYINDGSVVSAWNPVFDVTPANLITAIVTEKGVIHHPAENGVKHLQ